MRRRAFFLAPAAAFTACRQTTPALRLVTFPESYGHHLSIGLGFYRRNNIEVTPQFLQSFPKMMEAILAGEADIATANLDAVFPLVLQNKDITAFCCLANRPGTVLVASPAANPPITSIPDLRGKTIGIPGPGSSSHFLLNAILRRHQLEPSAFSTAAIGVAAGAIAAMEQGKVDAAMLTNLGLATLRLRHPQLTVLADIRTPEGAQAYLGASTYPTLCLVARASWLAAHRDLAGRFANCFLAANQWMASHDAAQVRDALPPAARAQDAAADIQAIRGMQPTLETTGAISLDAARHVWNITRVSLPNAPSDTLDFQRAITPWPL